MEMYYISPAINSDNGYVIRKETCENFLKPIHRVSFGPFENLNIALARTKLKFKFVEGCINCQHKCNID